MARLERLPPAIREHLQAIELPSFAPPALAAGPALEERRIAILSTAGIHLRSDPPYLPSAVDYRVIPADVEARDILMSHVSANFDRTGFQQDWNVVFPLDRLHEMAGGGEIGSVAAFHYSFMGATDPKQLEPAAKEVARLLLRDGVNGVLLVPV